MISLDRHSILVIGVGSIGERHLRCFLNTGRGDVSFVETNSELGATIAKRYPAAKMIDDLDSALKSRISAAVIATPAPSHVPLALELVNFGANVLIEKPLAVSFDGVDALRVAAQLRKTVAAVAYVYRAHPALAEMRQAIVSGRFGPPLEIVAVCGQHFPTYRPAYAQTYYASRANGGGAVQDALTHIINAGQWIVGPIDRLVADAAHQSLADVSVEDTVHVIARHGNVLGSYSLNQHQAPNEVTITVVCEGGVARFEYHSCRWRSMEKPDSGWTDHCFGPLQRDELFIRQAAAFLDAVEGRSPPLCTLDEAIMTLDSNITILDSIREGRWREVSR
jgi:predicted dehydrogenase